MRKYQRKLAGEIRDLYQSNDPLRYMYMATRLGRRAQYRPTAREVRIFRNRLKYAITKVTATIKLGLERFVNAVGNITKTVNAFADAMLGPKPETINLLPARVHPGKLYLIPAKLIDVDHAKKLSDVLEDKCPE